MNPFQCCCSFYYFRSKSNFFRHKEFEYWNMFFFSENNDRVRATHHFGSDSRRQSTTKHYNKWLCMNALGTYSKHTNLIRYMEANSTQTMNSNFSREKKQIIKCGHSVESRPLLFFSIEATKEWSEKKTDKLSLKHVVTGIGHAYVELLYNLSGQYRYKIRAYVINC